MSGPFYLRFKPDGKARPRISHLHSITDVKSVIGEELDGTLTQVIVAGGDRPLDYVS